jgi:hypothetical protein
MHYWAAFRWIGKRREVLTARHLRPCSFAVTLFLIEATMKRLQERAGKAGYLILWLLGVPIPILLLIFFLRGCN